MLIFDLSIRQIIQKKILNCLNIENNNSYKSFLEQQIRMISEGSCDTDDWSDDAELCFKNVFK